jgi:G6PDH family F420-dependent oxidoreductase
MKKLYYYLGHEQFQPEELVSHAVLAEKAGFDGLFVSEHFHPWVEDKGSSGFAFATLGAVAQATKKIELMTGVVTPLFRYHPAVVAQAIATIDRLSNGRVSLGVGTGESINESPLGYEFPKYKERSERMIEALEIMQRLLSGEKVTFKGEYYQTKNVKLYSPPLHKVPILLAAGGPKSGMLSAEHADGIIVSVKNADDSANLVVSPTRDKAKAIGKKDFQVTASRWSIYAQNDDEAFLAIQPWRGLRAPSRDHAVDPKQLQDEADSLSKEDILSRYSIVANASDYIENYAPLITTVNADTVVIQTTGKNQTAIIELLGKEVLPNLRAL